MATDYEELQLRVTLIDEASDKLPKIVEHFKKLGGGENAAAFRQMQKDTKEFADRFKPLGEDVAKATEKIAPFVRGVGGAATAVVAFTFATKAAYGSLKAFAGEMSNLGTFARSIGVSTAEVKVFEEQMARFGVSAQQTQAILAGASRARADLSKNFSQIRQTMMQEAGLDARSVEAMQERLKHMMEAGDMAGYLNEVNDMAKTLEKNIRAMPGLPEGLRANRAAEEVQKLLRLLADPALLSVLDKLHGPTAEQLQMYAQRSAATDEFLDKSERIAKNFERTTDAVKGLLVALPGVKTIMDGIASASEKIAHAAEALEKFAREHPNLTPSASAILGGPTGAGLARGWDWLTGERAMTPGGARIIERLRRARAQQATQAVRFSGSYGEDTGDRSMFAMRAVALREDAKKTEENTRQLKRLNDFLQQMAPIGDLLPGGAGVAGVPGVTGGKGGGVSMQGLGGVPGFSRGGSSDAGPGVGPGAGQTPARGGGGGGAPNAPSSASTPGGLPADAISPAAGQIGYRLPNYGAAATPAASGPITQLGEGRKTAQEAGISPEFPVASNVNWRNMDGEYLARMNAAYRAMPDSEKAGFKMVSGYRPATRAEARALGMDETSSQESVWERSGHGSRFAAAPPGRSRHGFGMAGDYTKTDWLRAHQREFGLQDIGARYDYPHIQLQRGDTRSFLADEAKRAGAVQPAAPQTVQQQSDRGTMLFLHGLQSRYGAHSPAAVEEQARQYATARGYNLEVIPGTGGQGSGQEEAAKARIAQGGVNAVFGFSAGGYAANRLREKYPGLDYTITGSPGVTGNVNVPGVRHMDLVGALANRAAIDRGMPKVEASGSITVDVNAPQGVRVGGKAGGMFNSVEINRNTPMAPMTGPSQAAAGP